MKNFVVAAKISGVSGDGTTTATLRTWVCRKGWDWDWQRLMPLCKSMGAHRHQFVFRYRGHCKSIVALAEQLLGKLGYRVVTKMNPVEALEAFRSNPDHFHAVITDMTMPQMTGGQLAQELMEIRKDIPIIICTGYSSMMNAEKARAAGIADYLMKPVDMRKMAQTIRKVLDQRES